jgi:acyl-coenzyme A thioesterase PaaI-like protein
MKAIDIPFVRHIGIEQEQAVLSLACNAHVMNHLKTIHASAQFALAETQSGIYLQTLFPELEGKAVPLLRDAQIKYRKPAIGKIAAFASSDDEAIQTFKMQFEKKGRGLLQVDVDVSDINNVLTSQATFTWFIQAL